MGKFEPKEPVQLNPPNYSPISTDELAKANGTKLARLHPLTADR